MNGKILEAIQRGVKFAIDDFDEDPIQNQKSGQISDTPLTKDALWLRQNFVDLGLPSGTLWAKYNLGCDWKKLNQESISNIKSSDWYGNYYAWGEIEEKELYDWRHYKFLNNWHEEGPIGGTYDKGELSKYVTHPYGDMLESNIIGSYKDDLTKLLLEDDAAYQYNNRFRIPTKEQCEELHKYTTQNWTYNGILNGMLFTSKINKNQLFIPAAGSKFINSNGDPLTGGFGNFAYIWTSSLYDKKPDCAYSCTYAANDCIVRQSLRFYGMPIRPVINR